MTVIHDPGNEARIERVYVFMSTDERGFNGIVAAILPGLGSTPLVTGKRSVAQTMIPIAQKVADETGKKVGLFVFGRLEDEELWQSK
jgi:hypothetical protein